MKIMAKKKIKNTRIKGGNAVLRAGQDALEAGEEGCSL